MPFPKNPSKRSTARPALPNKPRNLSADGKPRERDCASSTVPLQPDLPVPSADKGFSPWKQPQYVLFTLACASLLVGGKLALARRQDTRQLFQQLPTGRRIAPQGSQINVGSFPVNMALSPDGKFIAVTNTGFRQYISILSTDDGHLVSQLPFNPAENDRTDKTSLYYGLAFIPRFGRADLYVSRGPQDRISILSVDSYGQVKDTGTSLENPSRPPAEAKNAQPNFSAGIALNDSPYLYIANNESSAYTDFKGSVSILEVGTHRIAGHVVTPGFPYALVAVTKGPDANKRVYVSSEQDGCVAVLDVHDPSNAKDIKDIKTGDHPMALLLDNKQKRLFVANASSDTVCEIDTATNDVVRAWNLRGKSKLPGVTPTSLALSPDESRLYVTLADHNALAVLDLNSRNKEPIGLIPTGWYPTSVLVSPDGQRLFVANAKGARALNPNGANGKTDNRENYIENIIEGTVSVIPTPTDADLRAATEVATRLNLAPDNLRLPRTGIKHIIYIIKENRTYDEVLGDLPQGNGDKSLVLFGRDVTPNQHALAERFVLLDNFYCSAEVSADGWNWTTSGMSSEYTARNVPFNYSGRGRDYDFEGTINGIPMDLLGKPDVNRAPGGYIWDAVAHKGLTYRNYGFYSQFADAKMPDGKIIARANEPTRKALVGHTDVDFLRFDMNYADSDAYILHNAPAPRQKLTYGAHNAPSRFAEWKHEFDEYVRTDSLPAFSMVRLPRNHTSGTRPGLPSPRAMVADNDYAVGQLVEAVSKSKFWPQTAIFILEDDAQDGIDHVDAHRSTALVISPYIKQGTVDHHFYNSDSTLHSMEQLLGLSPMCQYDAIAPVFAAFHSTPDNDAPYTALLPARAILAETNAQTAYRASDSSKLDFAHADRVPDHVLNDILWHAIKGANTPMPAPRHTLTTPARSARRDDDD